MFVYQFAVNEMETKRISFTTKGQHLKYVVEAAKEVHFFIVDDKEYERFLKGGNFNWANKFTRGEFVEEEIQLKFSGNWNLLIANPSNETIGFNYKVYSK